LLVLSCQALALWYCTNNAWCQTERSQRLALRATDSTVIYLIGDVAEYLEDPSQRLSIDDVVAPAYSQRFTPCGKSIPNFGISTAAYWLRFRVLNSTQQALFVQMSNSLVQEMEVYVAQNNTVVHAEHHHPIADKSSPMWLFHLFPLPHLVQHTTSLPEDSTVTVYVRLTSYSPLVAAVAVGTAQSYLQRERWRLVLHAVFFGAMSVMILYNCFLVFTVRDRSYLYYVAYGAAAMLFTAFQSGILQALVGVERLGVWQQHGNSTLGLVSAVLVSAFAIAFLETKRRTPILHKLLYGLILLQTIVLLLGYINLPLLVLRNRFAPISAFAVAVMMLVTTGVLIRQKVREARLYLLAWLCWLVSIMTLTMMGLGIIPIQRVIEFLPHIAVTTELVFMSFALADKINVLREEKASLIAQQNERLETQVRERTLALEEMNYHLSEANEELYQSNAALAQTNEQLDAANRFKTKMVSIVSHDLRNPLNTIIGFAEVLRSPNFTKDVQTQALQQINDAAWRMVELIKNLLDSAANDLAKIALYYDTVNLTALLQELLSTYAPQAAAKQQLLIYEQYAIGNDGKGNANTTLQRTSDDVIMEGDSQRLYQVVENLLSNAIKYSPLGKTVRVKLLLLPTTLRIAVQDEGPGLSDDDKQRAFGFFERLSAQPTGGETSTGIGLAIVKNIVEAHGGTVWVESEQNNQAAESTGTTGATFVVELPQRQPVINHEVPSK
jgi:signal transduction histidine kinase